MAAPGYASYTGDPAALAMLGRAPGAAAPAYTGAPAGYQETAAPSGTWPAPATGQGSGSFDTKLLLIGLTAVAGTDQARLAAAEAWNPAVVARTAVAAGRHRLEIHRAQRRETERAHAYAAPAEPQFSNSQHAAGPAGIDAH